MFLLTALIAQAGALNPAISLPWLNQLAKLILVGLFAVTLITTTKKYLIVLAVISGSLAFYSAKAGLVSFLKGGMRFADGLAGPFMDNNGYALAIVMILPFLYAVGQNINPTNLIMRWIRRGFFIAIPLSIMTLICTFSRAGFLAFAVSIIVFILLQKRRIALIVVFTVATIISLVFIPFPKGYFDRIKTIQTYDEIQDDSAISRLHFWKVAVDMAIDHPLGIGIRGFKKAYNGYDFLNGRYGRSRSVHSSHFEVFAEMGFFGLFIWIGMFIYAFGVAFKIRKSSRKSTLSDENKRFFYSFSNSLIVSMVGFLVGGAFIELALNDLTWFTFPLVTSLNILYSKKCAPNEAPPDVVVYSKG
jgi:putative inorganic carbon (hco3(-)) transporter